MTDATAQPRPIRERRSAVVAGAIFALALLVAVVGFADAAKKKPKLPKNSVGTAQIKKGAVTEPKIATGAVGSEQIAGGAVQGSEIASGAVGQNQLAAGAVGPGQLQAGSVGADQLAAGAVGSSALAEGAVGAGNIAGGAVGSGAIAGGAVGNAQLGNGAVNGAKIEDGSVGAAEIAPGVVPAPTSGTTDSVSTTTIGNTSTPVAQLVDLEPGSYLLLGKLWIDSSTIDTFVTCTLSDAGPPPVVLDTVQVGTAGVEFAAATLQATAEVLSENVTLDCTGSLAGMEARDAKLTAVRLDFLIAQ